MAEFMYDADKLADALDALLAGTPPQDEVLLQTAARLLNAPPPTLSPSASARIEAQMLDAFRNLPPATPTLPTLPLIGGIIAVVLIIGVFMTVGLPMLNPPPVPTTTLTATTTLTQTPMATLTPTLTQPATPTQTASATATLTPTITLTQTAAPTPSPTAAQTAAPIATLPLNALPVATNVNLVIEGVVESINGTVIVVYGIEIHLNPDDPLLGVIQVGDSVRIEGRVDEGTAGIVIIAVTITFTQVDVVISDTGEVWRDDGSCNNPPPPWAPAHGWHRRCDSQPGGSGNGNGSDGSGRGRGNGGS
jgi:hypothetical protein